MTGPCCEATPCVASAVIRYRLSPHGNQPFAVVRWYYACKLAACQALVKRQGSLLRAESLSDEVAIRVVKE